MIASIRKVQLKIRGYSVEDMGAVWGSDFEGQYRWINNLVAGDGFGEIQYSVADAWADADQFDQTEF